MSLPSKIETTANAATMVAGVVTNVWFGELQPPQEHQVLTALEGLYIDPAGMPAEGGNP